MKITILTSCTGEKLHSPEAQLTQNDFKRLGEPAFQKREAQLETYRTRAEDLYTGQQHVRLMRGIQLAREKLGAGAVDLRILSAGYGLIPADQAIVPYECTFQGMTPKEISVWSDHLRIPEAARALFSEPADLTLVLLGDGYLRALKLDEHVAFAAPTLFFTSSHSQKLVKGQMRFRSVPVVNKDARRFGAGLVALKGELARRLLKGVVVGGQAFLRRLFDPHTDVLEVLDALGSEETRALVRPARAAKAAASQPSKTRQAARANPRVDQVITIPETWWQKPHRAKLRYFIPEWDDLVDPDYDFETDTHSGGSGDWSNEVYAHQMYPEPNYDGILISKVVAEKSKKKKERINAMGVHRFLRVPPEFPIMGDCGAFGYIMQEKPPYTTDEILDYYTRLGFNYGVSIDHLIVTATEAQKQFRYELTIHNADEFLREHKKRGLPWEPIGAVQGWDPQSYAEAARQYVAMGYKYIALGGLVRTSSAGILRVLEQVHEVVPTGVNLHLFGLARLNVMLNFAGLGVTSVDSASYLRRAWMGSGGQNYLTENGFYTAIRIPEAGKSFRAKRMVQDGRAESEKVEQLEKECLRVLAEFEAGRLPVKDTADVIEEYDSLITPNRVPIRPRIERTLEAAPWRSCDCAICKKDGIQVIIFRGNNRNRRRGFHNTYVFYRMLQRVLMGASITFGYEDEEVEAPEKAQMELFAMTED